jgi:hypothetical protein
VRRARAEDGSTLIEAVVAVAILTTGVVSLAGLTSVAVRTITLTRERTVAAIAAAQKLEELSAAMRPLLRSSPDAVRQDEAGFVEYLDEAGAVVGAHPGAPGVAYVRRWAVSPVVADASLTLIHVAVSPCRGATAGAGACGDAARSVRLATIRSSLTW